MKRLVLGLVCVAGLVLPSIASAALTLRIGDQLGAVTPDQTFNVPVPAGQQFFDLIFEETAPTENEGLFSYDLGFRVNNGGGPGGIRLAGAERPAGDRFVYGNSPGAGFTVAVNEPDHLLINTNADFGAATLPDIVDGAMAARIFYTLDAITLPGTYSIVFDTTETVFGSGDPDRELEIDVNLSDAGVVEVVPEPTALSLLGIAGLLALRRRRTA